MKEPHEGLSPEQQEQVENGLARGRAAVRGVTRAGLLGLIFRGVFRSVFRRPRFLTRKVVFFVIGLLVVVVSVATWSASVDLASLTAEYGEPARPTKDAARRFLERAATAMRSAPANRRFRITVSEVEATSALSLGLMMPELMRAMETVPPEQIQQADDIEGLRAMLREHAAVERETRTFRQRVAAVFDPRLRTGDVQVRFTGNGEIVVAGYVQAWRWQQPALVVFSPRARSGELELDFVKGRLGRLPAPAFAFDLLGRLASSLILQGQDYAEISNLTVEEGRLTFEASVTR
jgi:hypothetical protein